MLVSLAGQRGGRRTALWGPGFGSWPGHCYLLVTAARPQRPAWIQEDTRRLLGRGRIAPPLCTCRGLAKAPWPGRGLGDHVHPQPAEGSAAPPHSPIANHLARMKFKDRTYTLAKAIGLHPAHGVAFQHVSPKRAGTLLCSLPELPYLAGRPPSTGLKARCLDPRALGASTVCAFVAWVPEPGEKTLESWGECRVCVCVCVCTRVFAFGVQVLLGMSDVCMYLMCWFAPGEFEQCVCTPRSVLVPLPAALPSSHWHKLTLRHLVP